MASQTISHIFADVCKDRKIWSLTANKLKRNLTFWRGLVLILSVVGAGLETLAAQLHSLENSLPTTIGLLGAVALVLIPIIRTAKLGNKKTKAWVRARSISEGLKTEIYLYLTSTQPYDDPNNRDRELSAQKNEMTKPAEDLYRETADARNRVIKDNSIPSESMDVDTYIAKRVNKQINQFYIPKALKLSRQVEWLRRAEFSSSLVAAGLGIVPIFVDQREQIGAWVAVLTTIGIAITAHLAAARFDHLINTYLATADRLKNLRNLWLDTQQPNNPSDFIRQCEDTISVENQGWMAKFLQANGSVR